MFATLKKPINLVYLIQLMVVFLSAFGILPRVSIIGLTLLVGVFVLWADTKTATAFFVRSIPIFVAIPFTSYFDSFNLWRIASGLIFLKWFWQENKLADIKKAWQEIAKKVNFQNHEFSFFFLVFFVFAFWSLLPANDLVAGVKRIIYLINLSLISFVIWDLVNKRQEFAKDLIKNILIAGILVVTVALLQLISAYLVSIYEFMDFWAGMVQLVFYGSEWSQIAQEANTWFAYFGDQLSLRVFSTFPDSHSFPVFVLMTIPALLAFFSSEPLERRRTSFKWLVLTIFYLFAILSGTRGIWLAILGPILFLPFLIKTAETIDNKKILKHLGFHFIIFILLFSVAYPILGSDQFQTKKTDNRILSKRIRSILNLKEASNSGRIAIWKASVKSITKRPLLGVGVGNFPMVLSQETEYAKAGSSAHNLYLQIAAETGILGLLGALGILWLVLKSAFSFFLKSQDQFLKIYSAGSVIYTIWVLFYSLTDAVLFDERIFLIFAVNSAIILGLKKVSILIEKTTPV